MDLQQVVTDFQRDGVALCPALLDADSVAAARDAVDWAIANRTTDYKWIAQGSHEWFREEPVFVNIIEHPLVIDFARACLGPDFHLIAAQCSRNTKADPYAPGAMAFHQDA